MPVQMFRRTCFIALLAFPLFSSAFGVLTHEAIIDAAWDKHIMPYLKSKYPAATAEELTDAHAHAYGGAVAPDMGYYPRGSKFYTDLVHYVRSGDMVASLLKNAATLNELAFAIGFLSHYNADRYGHPLATNKSVPLVYQSVGEKYGKLATYEDDEIAHMRMEFGFDVLEVAKGNYASQSYRNFIGFKVDTAILSRAFTEVYGLNIYEVHDNHFYRSVENFRWVVANFLPLLTRQAWAAHQDKILEADSTATAKNFEYKMKRRNYDKTFGTGYKKPGFFSWLFSKFIYILPKVGPLKALKFKSPTAEAEKYFIQSFDTVLHQLTTQVGQLQNQTIELADIDLDTGKPTERCEYDLADITYASWLNELHKKQFKDLTAEQKKYLLAYYKPLKIPAAQEKNCRSFFAALSALRKLP